MTQKPFRPHEFECKCYECGLGFVHMNSDFVDRLVLARLYSGTAYVLTSAIRCKAHNQEVGGLDNSPHLNGLAVDIRAETAHERFKILYGLIKAGFKRIGIYEDFIHVDDDMTKPPEVCWYV